MVNRRDIFVMSINAAPFNLGDIYIRRAVIDFLRPYDVPVLYFAGNMPESYVEAFRPTASDQVVRRFFSFVPRFATHLLLSRVSLVLAPGPQWMGPSIRHHIKHGLLLLLCLFTKVCGGRVICFGRALEGRSVLADAIEAWIVRTSDVYALRDSRRALDFDRAAVAPDAAFLEFGQYVSGPRPYAAISIRGDTAIDYGNFEVMVRSIRESGLVPILATQVIEDDEQLAALATRFSISHLSWPLARSHSEQAGHVEALYRKSYIVISNRLHALLIGVNNGAFPFISHVVGDAVKCVVTLSGVPFGEIRLDLSGFQAMVPFSEVDVPRMVSAAAQQRAVARGFLA